MALQMLNPDILSKYGCQLAKPEIIFLGIAEATNGDPCTTGCAYFDNGACPAYQQWHSDRLKHQTKAPTVAPEKTVKQLAAELGISISEARRRKASGIKT